MGLINKSLPKEALRDAVIALAAKLIEKNPVVLRHAKIGFKRCRELTWEQGEDYLYAKTDQSNYRDPEKGRKEGLKQFLDDKTIKPGLQAYKRGWSRAYKKNACPGRRPRRGCYANHID
jgi:feruloyl-CoA hydratase/lyase